MKSNDKILTNRDIRHKNVRLVTESGSEVLPTFKAIELAEKQDLDLILINDKTDPPVCKILDFTKYSYDQKQKAKLADRAQRANRITVKEVQFKPNIDTHDFETKCKNITKFIQKGNVVKVQIQFRGRERQHTDIGFNLIERVVNTIDGIELDGKPQFSGNRITAILKGNSNGTEEPK